MQVGKHQAGVSLKNTAMEFLIEVLPNSNTPGRGVTGMHFTNDIGKSKIVSAEESLTALNPGTQVIAYREKLTASNALGIIQNYDVVLGCAGNFSTKFLLNDVCIMAGKPLFFARY